MSKEKSVKYFQDKTRELPGHFLSIKNLNLKEISMTEPGASKALVFFLNCGDENSRRHPQTR